MIIISSNVVCFNILKKKHKEKHAHIRFNIYLYSSAFSATSSVASILLSLHRHFATWWLGASKRNFSRDAREKSTTSLAQQPALRKSKPLDSFELRHLRKKSLRFQRKRREMQSSTRKMKESRRFSPRVRAELRCSLRNIRSQRRLGLLWNENKIQSRQSLRSHRVFFDRKRLFCKTVFVL